MFGRYYTSLKQVIYLSVKELFERLRSNYYMNEN